MASAKTTKAVLSLLISGESFKDLSFLERLERRLALAIGTLYRF
jgi:hypothetical protein